MFQGPKQTPQIGTLLDSLPTRDLKLVARHLGVTTQTLKKWAKTGNAPRMAHLALFWETKWGLSALHAYAVNGERYARAQARSLEDQIATLRARIAYLEANTDHGAANVPFYEKA